jgi:two-component system, LytTR family, response regulator
VGLRALIVDDEPIARRTLEKCCQASRDLEVVGQSRHGAEAVEAIRTLKPDIVFLDIEMRDVGGFAVIEQVGPEHMPLVVFVTAFDRYAVKAFEVNAVDYLLKPFDESRFEAAMKRVRERLTGGITPTVQAMLRESLRAVITASFNRSADAPLKRIAADRDGRVVFVDVDDIECIEARGNYILVHKQDESFLLRSTLQQTESTLDRTKFLRIHRSIIVNTTYIREMQRSPGGEYTVTLRNGQSYTASGGYNHKLLEFIRRSRP